MEAKIPNTVKTAELIINLNQNNYLMSLCPFDKVLIPSSSIYLLP